MAPSLDALPDMCLIAIFVHLPLWDLISAVGLVCGSLRAFLPFYLANRGTLKVVQTDSVVKRFEPEAQFGSELIYKVRREDGTPWVVRPRVDRRSVLVLPKTGQQQVLTKCVSYRLTNTFHDITNLTIIQAVTDSWLLEVFPQVARMLDHWQDSLVSLSLALSEDRQHFLPQGSLGPFAQSLFESIDRLHSLRSLALDLNIAGLPIPPQMQIFSRLNTVTFNQNFPWPNWMFASLNANVETIQHIYTDYSRSCQEWAFWPIFASRFHKISIGEQINLNRIGRFPNSLENFLIVCARFTSLNYVNIKFGFDLFASVTQCLSQLGQLVHLRMSISRGNLPSNLTELTQIPSVRLLTMHIAITQSHSKLSSLRLWHVLPNVQVLNMSHQSMDCRDCGYEFEAHDYAVMADVCRRRHECKRLARRALTRFPNLHTIQLRQHPGTSSGSISAKSDVFNSLDLL